MSKDTAFNRVLQARSKDKISIKALIDGITDDFIELHGDRAYGDDPAVYAGIGSMNDKPVTIVGIRKGDDDQTDAEVHFGSAEPDGYRKALRLMKQAEKFKRPIITLINTPGAYPDVEAEYHGQGYMISQLIMQGMQLKVPYIAVIVGEGGSGGALALAVGDCVWAFEESIYSILSPEGYATILWKDSSRAREAAEVMKLTPEDLIKQGIIDRIIPEIRNNDELKRFKADLFGKIEELSAMPTAEMLNQRFARYRNF
ncbi:acetyl-CoA carboxylase carboxyl transferase subunit alpha [Fructilactobacillus lindneri]|uniref:acetyl-CoA carboxytransferase n=2 Tax=Fructilactobacillus lindneri TaxID=53444 RepID=A0A0R2JNQ0_9LACO|nr:carboxyltransferase subunit alpha [Fructilactobacillus lindneri]ANZ57808.1 acetyl-CoA carboxylase carboxyl transferase subunit alpha [Fructilactobacillus lindneri]ANZ59077.1 acetyl-CoA carboxylase carboxyl transferase subunit alpha [Fructilactobacillus lindneri]KRN78744.1 acetyl-CoA carboxylase carboxyl transferase subunit alpha [Fructilactobacillus lindneri DSM 20690 = JCM 11027]POG98131.1 acetyl-CoA carboxylase carboxyl transferase subunit alpha [Fructilactobacillus lindneri]POH01754.1 ac